MKKLVSRGTFFHAPRPPRLRGVGGDLIVWFFHKRKLARRITQQRDLFSNISEGTALLLQGVKRKAVPSEILQNISLYCVNRLANFRLLFNLQLIRSYTARGSGTSVLSRWSLQKLTSLPSRFPQLLNSFVFFFEPVKMNIVHYKKFSFLSSFRFKMYVYRRKYGQQRQNFNFKNVASALTI